MARKEAFTYSERLPTSVKLRCIPVEQITIQFRLAFCTFKNSELAECDIGFITEVVQ